MPDAVLPAEPAPTPVKHRLAITAGYFLTFAVLGMTAAVVGPTLLGLGEQTHTPISLISLVFPANSLGYLFGTLLGGRLYDRTPGHPLLAAGLASTAVILALVPLASHLVLLLAMAVLGFSQALLDVGGNTLLVWVHQDKVAPFMNGLHFFFGVGTVAAPLVVAWAIQAGGGIAWGYRGLALLWWSPSSCGRCSCPALRLHQPSGRSRLQAAQTPCWWC